MITGDTKWPRCLTHAKQLIVKAHKYDSLIEDIAWFFETDDALRTVRLLVSQGRCRIGTYGELAAWAGDIEGKLRRLRDEK